MSSNNRVFLAARDAEVLKMSLTGASNQQIAEHMKMTTSAVAAGISRQLKRNLKESAPLGWAELARKQLETMDALQVAIWPLTQHRKIVIDGNEMVVEPDIKATQMVLNIMRERIRLLGLEQVNVNVNVTGELEPIRSSLDGAVKQIEQTAHDPRSEALALMKLMFESGAMSGPEMDAVLKSVGVETLEELDELEEDEQLALPPAAVDSEVTEGEVVE